MKPATRALLLRHGLTLSIGLGALFYVLLAGLSGWRKVEARLVDFRWPMALGALGLALVNYGLRFLKWQLYLRTLGIRVARPRSLGIFLSGFSLTVTPLKVGEVLKSYLLRESDGVAIARSAPIVVAERATDLIACLVLTVLGLSSFGASPRVLATILAGTAMVAVLVAALASRRIGALAGRLSPRLAEMHAASRELLAPRPLLLGTALSVGAWACECAAFWLVLGGFPAGGGASLGLCTFIYALTTIGGAVSFMPGGLGVQEGGMIELLRQTARGVDEPTAFAATFVTRLCTLWFAVLIGVVALVLVRRRVKVDLAAVAALDGKPAPLQ